MKQVLSFLAVCMLTLAVYGSTQDFNRQPVKGETTKAIFYVPNQHCPECATTLEASLKKVSGIISATVSFPNKTATIEFDVSAISSQEVARAAFHSAHAMGKDMKYGTFLLLSVPDAKDKATGVKATVALGKVAGVEKAVFYSHTRSIAIQFADKGSVTSSELINRLKDAGVKAGQYTAPKSKNEVPPRRGWEAPNNQTAKVRTSY